MGCWPWQRKKPIAPLWDSRPEWWRAVACHELIKANLEYAKVVAKGLKEVSEVFAEALARQRGEGDERQRDD